MYKGTAAESDPRHAAGQNWEGLLDYLVTCVAALLSTQVHTAAIGLPSALYTNVLLRMFLFSPMLWECNMNRLREIEPEAGQSPDNELSQVVPSNGLRGERDEAAPPQQRSRDASVARTPPCNGALGRQERFTMIAAKLRGSADAQWRAGETGCFRVLRHVTEDFAVSTLLRRTWLFIH